VEKSLIALLMCDSSRRRRRCGKGDRCPSNQKCRQGNPPGLHNNNNNNHDSVHTRKCTSTSSFLLFYGKTITLFDSRFNIVYSQMFLLFSRGNMHCDRVSDCSRSRTSEHDDREARYWSRKLYEFEANDPDRWAHASEHENTAGGGRAVLWLR